MLKKILNTNGTLKGTATQLSNSLAFADFVKKTIKAGMIMRLTSQLILCVKIFIENQCVTKVRYKNSLIFLGLF